MSRFNPKLKQEKSRGLTQTRQKNKLTVDFQLGDDNNTIRYDRLPCAFKFIDFSHLSLNFRV